MATRRNIVLVLSSICIPNCASFNIAPKIKRVKTTAYSHGESDHIKYGRKTAIGTTLRTGVIATDWSVFPVGTRLRIEGNEYVVEDYGPALIGKDVPVVDIYKPSLNQMRNWGAKYCDAEIVEMGCFDKSKDILSSRLRYKHCRQMYEKINEKPLHYNL